MHMSHRRQWQQPWWYRALFFVIALVVLTKNIDSVIAAENIAVPEVSKSGQDVTQPKAGEAAQRDARHAWIGHEPRHGDESREKPGDKTSDLVAEAEEEMNEESALASTVSVDVERLQTLWRQVFENIERGKGDEDASSPQAVRTNREELQREFARIQQSLHMLMSHINETKEDLTQVHDALEQKETLDNLEELVRQGKMGVNYETGELTSSVLKNLSSAFPQSGAAGSGEESISEENNNGVEISDVSDTETSALSMQQQEDMAAAVSKLQQAVDPAVLHLDVNLLRDVVVLSVSTALGGFGATVMHLPPAFGFIVAGMVIGPSGLKVMTEVTEVETLAQFGSIFLLFGHGMLYCQQYQLSPLGSTLPDTFLVGLLILSAIFFLSILAYTWCLGPSSFYQATLVASAVSLSSTTATAHALLANRLRETGYGKTLVELMAVQDLLMAPLLSIPTAIKELLFQHGLLHMLPVLMSYALALLAAAVVSKRLMPRLINLRNRAENSLSLDLFILGLVAYCLLMSLLTEWMGLSYEAGALLAGLIVADVPQVGKAVAVMEPLTCLFGGMYLGSLGMILSPAFLAHHAGTILLCVAVMIVIKVASVSLGMRSLGYSLKASVLGALSMAQISELSLFLVSRAQEYKLISRQVYLMVVATTVVLLMLTPFSSHALKHLERVESKVGVNKSSNACWFGAPLASPSRRNLHRTSLPPSSTHPTGNLLYSHAATAGGAVAGHRRPMAGASKVGREEEPSDVTIMHDMDKHDASRPMRIIEEA